MDDFAASLNLVTRSHIDSQDLFLHTTSGLPERLKFPDLENFRIFYIGVNWERTGGNTRHDSLIELLDKTNMVDFYGITNQHGIDLWKGVKNYKGELPFDGGPSILEKSNECGVSLVLHAKPHRRSGLVSTRIFQACAAKTLTICDNNPFILEHFGNSVLSFDYTEKPDDNFQRIMQKVEWINQNPDAAREKALRAYDIYRKKFSLEMEITNLIDQHTDNVVRYMGVFSAGDPTTQVDALYICKDEPVSAFQNYLEDVKAQIGIQTRAVVFVPPNRCDAVKTGLSLAAVPYEIVRYEPDVDGRLPLEGSLVSCYLKDHSRSPWFAVYSPNCRWKRLHLTQLVRASQDHCTVAMSGTYVKCREFSELTNEYYTLSMKSISGYPKGINMFDIGNYSAGRFAPSSMLFSTAFFQSQALQKTLGFFDKGWAFFLVVWNYLQKRSLPIFVPKLTTIFQRNDEFWHVDAYADSQQTESFERALGQSFIKYDPNYASIREFCNDWGLKNPLQYRHPSVSGYVHNLLRYRPRFRKILLYFFSLGRSLLGLPHGKEFSDERK
jgi:hypothetical protein